MEYCEICEREFETVHGLNLHRSKVGHWPAHKAAHRHRRQSVSHKRRQIKQPGTMFALIRDTGVVLRLYAIEPAAESAAANMPDTRVERVQVTILSAN